MKSSPQAHENAVFTRNNGYSIGTHLVVINDDMCIATNEKGYGLEMKVSRLQAALDKLARESGQEIDMATDALFIAVNSFGRVTVEFPRETVEA